MKYKKQMKEWKIQCLYYIFRVFPINKKKVVFCNYLGKGYGCNPKYIAEEIRARHNDWDLVWLSSDTSISLPSQIRAVEYESVRSIYELATAGVWIDNQRKLSYNKKRKEQYFVETWHGGGGPMKKIGADNPRNFGNKPYEKTSLHMNRIANLMIANSTCCTKVYRSAFLYTGEILECGYPRNDLLALKQYEESREKIYEFFHLPRDKKTVLYAPTYRNTRNLEQYTIDMQRMVEALQKKFGGEFIVLLRLHPTMLKKAGEVAYSENILNASIYDDMQELLAASDILISDYSSIISEFAITEKPIFLFATDVQEYAVERDFYVDYYSLPFSIAENNDKLVKNIEEHNEACYKQKVSHYLEGVGMCESGTAAKQIVDRIEKWNS